MECEFCHKTLKNKYTLKIHQTSAKSCLTLRGETLEVENNSYICSYCNKNLTTKQNLVLHIQKCKNAKCIEYEERIRNIEISHQDELKKTHEEYKKLLEKKRERYTKAYKARR